ncbi:MAG: 2TM domain-containing protein, partial [Planctomycetota bacterium]
ITEIQPGPEPAPSPPPAGAEHGRAYALSSSSRIEVVSEEADVVLRGVDGPAEVSGDGRIEVKKAGDVLSVQAHDGGEVMVSVPRHIPVSVATLEGTLRGANLTTRLTVKTEEGNVELAGLQGGLRVATRDGDLTLRRLVLNDLQVKGEDSDVLIDGLALQGGSGHVSTAEGDVRINVDPNRSSFRFRLTTLEGEVKSPLATAVAGTLEGRIGAGEGWLEAESGEGDVILDVTRAGGMELDIHIGRKSGKGKGSGWGGFLNHFGVFVIVCGGLAALNYVTQGAMTWALVVMGAWGIGVGLHFWGQVVRTFMGVDAREWGKSGAMERSHKIKWKRPWVSFSHHLGSYLAVNGFLLFVNVYTGGWPNNLWFLWVAGPWGFGLALHGWSAMVRWLRELWIEEERPEPPPVDAVKANRRRVVRKWAGFVAHFGTYVVVCAFLCALNVYSAGRLTWAPWVLAAWGIGIVTGFWGTMTEILAYISMEKAYRRGGKRTGVKRERVPLLGKRKWLLVLMVIGLAWAALVALNWKNIRVKFYEDRLAATVSGRKIAKVSAKLLAMNREDATELVARKAQTSALACLDKSRRILLVHDSVSRETILVYPGRSGELARSDSRFKEFKSSVSPNLTRETYNFGGFSSGISEIRVVEKPNSGVVFGLRGVDSDSSYAYLKVDCSDPNRVKRDYGQASQEQLARWRSSSLWPGNWK